MLKSLKDARRRMTQTIVEKVGSADVTVDEEYDVSVAKFKEMCADLNECGATMHTMLNDQKKGYADAQMLANSLARIYERNAEITDWPGVTNAMTQRDQANQFKEKWDSIFEVIRSSCFMVCSEFALDPLRAAVTKMGPEVEAICKQRNLDVKDFDSYTRRLKGLMVKKEQFDAQGKGNSPAALENDAEIEKFQLKAATGEEQYNASNAKAKKEIVSAKKAHDEIMDLFLATTAVCQHQMFMQAAAQLEDIIAQLPPNRVEQAKKNINQYISEGGIKPAQEEKSKLQKGIDIATGKAVPSDFKKSDEQVAKERAEAEADRLHAMSLVGKNNAAAAASSNPFGDDGADALPPAVPASAPPAPAAGIGEIVTALFDHEVDEDDELPFSVGDKIEVTEKADGGWWKGKCNGKEGLFPTNYVK